MGDTLLHQAGLPVVIRGQDQSGPVQSQIRLIRASRMHHDRCVHLARALIARDSSRHPLHRAIGAASHHVRAVYDQHSAQSIADLLSHAIMESQECLEKVAETIRLLIQPGESFVLLLTGEVQKERAAEILGLYPCGFRPQHSGKLGNEFRLFSNYDPETRLGGWEK